jgi:hypothetical protein
MKKSNIQWSVIKIDVSKIKPTPNNFKLKTEDGTERFKTSVDTYGLAGAVILNADYTLIDGNTRVEKAKEKGIKKIDASIPNRKLTPKEFADFSAMYDMARAGEVDILRIKEELGTTDDWFKKWGFDLPSVALAKLAEMEKNEKVINPTASRKIAEDAKEVETSRITLLFTPDEAEECLKLAESLYKPFKTDNITDLVLKVLRQVRKQTKK